jgi:lysozyme family protein
MRSLLACLVALFVVSSAPAIADPANMTRAIANVVVAEGGYANHPADPGGVTLNGVIQRVYDADRDARHLPRRPLTRAMLGKPEWIAERDAIYSRLYWEPCAGPPLPRGVDYIVLDMCVNSGIKRGWSMLMRVLGLVTDAPWSPILEVLPAIERKGVRSVIRAYGEERRRFYRGLAVQRPSMGVFLTGWINRETHSRQIAFNMASGTLQGSSIVMAPQPYRMGKAIDDQEDLIP